MFSSSWMSRDLWLCGFPREFRCIQQLQWQSPRITELHPPENSIRHLFISLSIKFLSLSCTSCDPGSTVILGSHQHRSVQPQEGLWQVGLSQNKLSSFLGTAYISPIEKVSFVHKENTKLIASLLSISISLVLTHPFSLSFLFQPESFLHSVGNYCFILQSLLEMFFLTSNNFQYSLCPRKHRHNFMLDANLLRVYRLLFCLQKNAFIFFCLFNTSWPCKYSWQYNERFNIKNSGRILHF